jgi:septal ring factor EnvC (AmiA/AmiB activator)
MERVAVYVRAVRRFDEARFDVVRDAVKELNERRGALEASFIERKSVQDAATAKRIDAESQANKLKALSDQLNQKKRSAEASLAKLRKEAERLELLMAALMSRDTSSTEAPQDGPTETPATAVPEPRPDREVVLPGTTAGVGDTSVTQKIELVPGGLFSKAVRIRAPVKGTVVQRFGKVKVTDFADMIFSKGLEFAAGVGAEVFAVLAGKVAFVGSLPGYETVVVVDHGSRSYSLYGRLGQSMVKAGQLVSRDQTIGITGTPDAKGRNFYFEVRKNGTPVDPTRVLTSLSR